MCNDTYTEEKRAELCDEHRMLSLVLHVLNILTKIFKKDRKKNR